MEIGWIANRSIRFKLLVTFFVIIFFSILTLGILGGRMYKRSIEEETVSHTIQIMNQVKNQITIYVQQMDSIVYYLQNESAIIEFLKLKPPVPSEVSFPLKTEVNRFLGLYENKHPEIAGILLAGANGSFTSDSMERITRDPLTEEEWYQLAVKEPDTFHLISHPIGRNIRAKHNLSADQVMSFVKAVKEPQTGNPLGVILIDMKLELIRSLIEPVLLGKSGFIFIMDDRGGVVYSPVNPIVYRIAPEWFEGGSGNMIKSINGLPYQIIFNTFPDIGWRICGVFPLRESLKVVYDLQFYTVVIALITFFAASVASWIFTDSIIRPVRKLRSLMKKVEAGELHLRFHSRTNDEIGQLGNSFNKMVEEIKNLINLVVHEQREKREIELKALQAQIKPHFLYNTLDTIQWMAYERDAQDIVDIVIALTNLFRISLSKGNEFIPLAEELRHIESYLIIQMARYENKLQYSIEVPDEIRTCIVLKIMLQPLVENSIYHGIKMKQGKGTIRIRGEQAGSVLILSVEDDGIGIPPGQLNQLRAELERPRVDERSSGYGLFNVHERIQLSYGTAYGLTVDSKYGEGTVVRIVLPLTRNETMG